MKVLVFRFGSLGDTVLALPALSWIRSHYGAQSEITLLENRSFNAEVAIRHLLENTPYIDHFLAYPTGNRSWSFYRELLLLSQKIRREKFDVVISLAPGQRFGRVAHWRDSLFFLFCLIWHQVGFFPFPRRIIYPRDANGRPAVVPSEACFLFERLTSSGFATGRSLADPLSPPDIKLTEEESKQADAWLAAHRRHPDRPLVIMAPGAKQPVNRWPPDRYAALGSLLLEKKICEILIVGGKNEISLQERLLNTWQDGLGASGMFSPRITAAIMARSQLFIGPDSGPVHLASAVGVPCVAIFSDRDNPGRWHPLGKGHHVIRKAVHCGGCCFSTCPRSDHLCMTSISTSEVLDVVLKTLS
ncbi:MAG: glycosyltransferase family 9 protein [Magnetococcales bacterium]|nr:glycosyltransferase family 9 protein [Magnetococcales bacterium]MBF0322967.1 glycosyltransferase family 9 protein [Magnetococcales bacterium]